MAEEVIKLRGIPFRYNTKINRVWDLDRGDKRLSIIISSDEETF
jgi:hypothetical protein